MSPFSPPTILTLNPCQDPERITPFPSPPPSLALWTALFHLVSGVHSAWEGADAPQMEGKPKTDLPYSSGIQD